MAAKRKRRRKPQISLVWQVAFFFMVGVMLTGCLASMTLRHIALTNVKREKEALSADISKDVSVSILEYPSYEWLIDYWIKNYENLDIEYDTEVITLEKVKTLCANNPGFVPATASEEDVLNLSPEDQKVYAEVIYNWMLDRFNRLMFAYNIEFLYLLATDDAFMEDIFLINASDGSRPRGKEYGQAYELGVQVTNTDEQHAAMMEAAQNKYKFAYAGDFMDRYSYFDQIGKYHLIIGATFEISTISSEAKSQATMAVVSFVSLQIVLSAFCLVLINVYAIKPLRKVQEDVYEYGDNKDGEAIRKKLDEITSKNEIGSLASEISIMVEQIDDFVEKIHTITAEKERIGAELNVATQIQADMLPRIFPPFPDIKEFDLYATMNPAKEVGGDFYDFFMVDDDHIALVMADVSGKGVPAALFMVIAKTLIKNKAIMGESPSQVLYEVNNQLCEGNTSELFVTVWMAIIDIRTGKGIAANAGHEHPVLKRKDGKFELIKYRHSPAVATFEGVKFKEHEFELHPGDRIFVYTDGVPEATNVEEELYGDQRMLDALNSRSDVSPRVLLAVVKASIDEFVGGAKQFDDITMLCFDYYGKQDEGEKDE